MPLIEAAQKFGLKIITVDRNPLAPGFASSNLRIEESITNYRKIFYKLNTLMLDGEIVGGYCASFGAALLSFSYLSEKLNILGLPRPVMERLLDKYEVRKKISSELHTFYQPVYMPGKRRILKKEFDQLRFPAIIKPRSGWGKKNIVEIHNKFDFKFFMRRENLNSRRISPESLIIEEKIEGDEITVVGFVQNFRFILICITDKITSGEAPFIELEHRFPSRHLEWSSKITDAHQEIVQHMQINDSPIVSEWKIHNGKLFLIEISAQIPGEYLANYLIPKAMGYDYFKSLVKITLGQPIELLPSLSKSRPCIIKYIVQKPNDAEYNHIKGNSDMLQILNEQPLFPPESNHDRYAVSAYLG